MNQATQLRQLLNQNQTLIAPGVFDGLSARLVEQCGFQVIYASGGAIARSTGVPDIGLLSLTEVRDQLADIVRVTNIPVVADADTGFGNEINVKRTIEEFERIGVAGLHLEDQTFPKRCGHLDGKDLISTEDMCLKIKTACAARTNKDLVIIARTDAIAVEGFDAAIARANAYVNAGADMIFVEAPTSEQQIETIAKQVPGYKLINMFHGGKTPMVPIEKLKTWGFQLVIIPSDLQRAAIHAMQKTLNAISADGNSQSIADELASFAEREEIIRTKDYLK